MSSKFDDVLGKCKDQMKKCGIKCDEALLEKVAKALGPSIYSRDSILVATSQKSELETIKKKYLIKKLGCEDGPELDKAIKAATTKIGPSNRNKLRPVFYYLLCKEVGKESVYS